MSTKRDLVSEIAGYSYTVKPCLKGDCKNEGTTDLVKCGHSYWMCVNCTLNASLCALGTTCLIGDSNTAPTANIRKQFIAKGGKIKLFKSHV